jgi:SOS-response transcriptional repressor LexA
MNYGRPLTRRQAQCLHIIENFVNTYGHAPTLRELAKELGVVSVCSPSKLTEALRNKGYLKAIGTRRQSVIASPDLERNAEYRRGFEDGYFEGMQAAKGKK